MTAILLLALFVAVAALAPRYGVDTRDGADWQPRGTRPATSGALTVGSLRWARGRRRRPGPAARTTGSGRHRVPGSRCRTCP